MSEVPGVAGPRQGVPAGRGWNRGAGGWGEAWLRCAGRASGLGVPALRRHLACILGPFPREVRVPQERTEHAGSMTEKAVSPQSQ